MSKYFLFLLCLSLGVYGEEDFTSFLEIIAGEKFPEEEGAWETPSPEDKSQERYKKLLERSQAGEAEAQYELGIELLRGFEGNMEPNPNTGFQWILRAAIQDYREARQRMLKAAEQGNRVARYWLFTEGNQYHEDRTFRRFTGTVIQGAKLAATLPEGQIREGNSENCYMAIAGDDINNLFR